MSENNNSESNEISLIPPEKKEIITNNNSAIVVEPVIFYLNSQSRIGGDNNSFISEVNIPKGVNYTKAVILQAVIPKSYYNVPTDFNTFTVTENGISRTVTITKGNYDVDSLILELLDKLNIVPSYYVYSIVYSDISGKYTFTVTDNLDQPSFTFTARSAYQPLGFSKNTTKQFSGDELESVNVVDLSGERTLFIYTDMIQNEIDSVLQEVYVSSYANLSSIHFIQYNESSYAKRINKKNSDRFRFTLYDENKSKIDLNGVEWDFTLKLF